VWNLKSSMCFISATSKLLCSCAKPVCIEVEKPRAFFLRRCELETWVNFFKAFGLCSS
jgi:hypothetical protein